MATPLEEDVGISEFVSELPGFHGILKHRFRDFIVREVDLKGEVARLTSLVPGSKGEDGSATPETKDEAFSPAKLAAVWPQVVASFAALAGPENGVLLDDLLRHVMAMHGIKESQEIPQGTDSGTMEEFGTGAAVVAEAATGATGLSAPGAAAAEPAATFNAPSCEAPSIKAEAGYTDTASSGGSEGGKGSSGGQLQRTSIQLLPMPSKELRKAVHEFFRATPGLPPLRTEAVKMQAESKPQQQQPEQHTQQQGIKRSLPEGAEEGRPAKWQKDGGNGGRGPGRWGDGSGGGARGGGRGGGFGGRGRGSESQPQSNDQQLAAQAVHRIQVIFEPSDLKVAAAGAGDNGRGHSGGRGGKGGWGDRRRGGDWEGGNRHFVRFVLYKENLDTQFALTTVGRNLGLNANGQGFGFAGTKDKRGVTCQFATAYKVSPARLAALNARLRGIRVGSFSFCDEGLRLGRLSGNEFHLVMRDVRLLASEAEATANAATAATEGVGTGSGATSGTEAEADVIAQVTEACEAAARDGFINYFGLQRFGTGGASTQEVGRALLRGEYEQAVHLVLTGRSDERKEYADARRLFFDHGDAKGALRGLPNFMMNERAVLGVLAKQPTAWAAAMLAVPRTMRMMYLHAWQSYVWNSAASHRIRMYGHTRVVAGDLVMPRGTAATPGGEGPLLGGGYDGVNDGEGRADDVAMDEGSEGASASAARRLSMVKLVTDADVAAGRYSVFDVVLPLPGTEVQYPTHSTGAWLRKVASEVGVDLDCPAASAKGNKDLSFASLSGDYRYLLHRPKDFHFAFKRYSNPNDDSLILTDLELLARSEKDSEGPAAPSPSEQGPSRNDAQINQGKVTEEGTGPSSGRGAESRASCSTRPPVSGSGPLLALELRFQLPSSCYATMLLRELTKTSTSRSVQMIFSAAAAAVADSAPVGAADGEGANSAEDVMEA